MLSQIRLAQTLIFSVRSRAREARAQGRNQLGASAIEWAIISAVVVGLALLIYRAIRGVVEDKAGEIEDESGQID